jgi:hypothetical protein
MPPKNQKVSAISKEESMQLFNLINKAQEVVKPKKTRTMSPELLEKLAKARQCYVEQRRIAKLSKETVSEGDQESPDGCLAAPSAESLSIPDPENEKTGTDGLDQKICDEPQGQKNDKKVHVPVKTRKEDPDSDDEHCIIKIPKKKILKYSYLEHQKKVLEEQIAKSDRKQQKQSERDKHGMYVIDTPKQNPVQQPQHMSQPAQRPRSLNPFMALTSRGYQF